MSNDALQRLADQALQDGRYTTAIAIYLALAEGDPSLDGGSLGHAIGEGYEKLEQLHAARYWYARAFEENPGIELYRTDYERTRAVTLEPLLLAS